MFRPHTPRSVQSALAILILLALLVTGAGAATGQTRAASAPVLTLGAASVAPGDAIKVSASGFKAGEGIRLTLTSTGTVTNTVTLAQYNADDAGSLTVKTLIIPLTTPAGAYTFRATGAVSTATAEAPLAIVVPVATVTVSPASFGPGDLITVSAHGFAALEAIQFTLSTASGSTAIALGQASASSGGTVTAKHLRVPYGVTTGAMRLVATGLKSNRQAIVMATISVPAAAVTVSPVSVRPGDLITITGSHFQPNEAITLDLVALSTSSVLASIHAGSQGTFSLSRVAVPKTVPAGTLTLVATGLTSHLSATTQITIVQLAAVLTIAPTTVTAGATVRLTGSNFIPGETLTVQLSGGNLPPITVASAIANSSGAFAIDKLVIPTTFSSGSYTLTVFGQLSGRASRAALKINAPAAGPTLTVLQAVHAPNTPYKLYPGGLATIAGSHFPAGAAVRISLRGPAGLILLVQVAATASGAVGPLGITIPATTKAGAYMLEGAVGGTRLASVQAVVAALSPAVALSSSTLVPGHALTVHGSGFAAGEQVVIALNGNALRTTPTSVLADTSGAFTVSLVVPVTVNDGANLITVSGVTSRATVSARAIASLPVASSWYLPHGDTTGGTRTEIALLNPGNAVASVKMTFLYPDGPLQHYATTLGAHSQGMVDLGLVAGIGRHMSTILTSDRQIGAQSTITYAGADTSTTVGASGPSTAWYLAEGYTNGSFREFLQIMNPNDGFATVDVRFLPFNNRPARETRFVMRPQSSLEIDAGSYMPGLSISSIVTADKPIVVERSMRFGQSGRGAHDQVGATSASTIWSFAQGQSSADSQTFFTILNPNQAAPAAVTATFFDRHGTPVGAKTIIVDPLHRGNIKLNDILPNAQVAAIFTSNVPVVVERPLYQGPANLALDRSGSVVFGRNGGALSWTFPDVRAGNGNEARMYLFNPGLKTSQVHATFYLPNGGMAGQDYMLAPNSVSVIDVNTVPNLPAGVSGAVLKCVNGQVFLAELGIVNAAMQHATSTQGISQ